MHIPVLYKEAIEFLSPSRGQKFVDATAGGGGHTQALLEKETQVLAIDRDEEAVESLREHFAPQIENGRLVPRVANFADLEATATGAGFGGASGILFDLGLSSNQLDRAERGFAFQKDGPLDMRFSKTQTVTASSILSTSSETELIKIFWDYGEEKRFARKVARAVVNFRSIKPIASTGELFELIKRCLPPPIRFRAGDTARRIFQSLRISVNGELEDLSKALPQALSILIPKGRIVVISFHSLEDRIVKNFFNQNSRQCICPQDFPICQCGSNNARLKILTKKPVTATPEEIERNPRARSAKLRAAEKIK